MNIAANVIATMSTVVNTEARTILIRVAAAYRTARRRIAQTGCKSERGESEKEASNCVRMKRISAGALRGSAQARPVVGDENRIAGIRRIVFHAGGLTCDEAFETDLPFETGDVLRGVIRDAGNCVTVRDEVPRPQIDNWPGARTEKFLLRFTRLGRMFGQLDDLPFRDAPNLIQVQTAPALRVLGLFRRTKKSVGDHSKCNNRRARHGKDKLPVREQRFQLAISKDAKKLRSDAGTQSATFTLAARKGGHSSCIASQGCILPKQRQDSETTCAGLAPDCATRQHRRR